MTTDLATLLGKRLQRPEVEENDEEEDEKPKRARKMKKTKEERELEDAQSQLFFEEKYRCDYETYTIERVEMRPSKMNPDKQVVIIKWLNNNVPPPEVLANMGQATQRLAIASKGGLQGEREWAEAHSKCSMTSSILARIALMAEPHVSAEMRVSQSFQALLEKAHLLPKFQGNSLTEHGTRMEPFCRKVYMQERAKQTVIQVGFIPHPTNPLCGASPDGIVLDGSRLVELKCPKQRYFQEGNSAPLSYWHQIKFQIEVCAAATATAQHPNGLISHCDYFECRHMKRPKGLRTNCVDIMRDKYWFDSIQPMIKQYDIHLKRLKKLRKLFPDHLFTVESKQETFEVVNTMPKLFKAVQLEE